MKAPQPKPGRAPKQGSSEDDLMKAILENDETSVTALLGLGVQLNCSSSDTGLTPAVAAAENGYAPILRHLMNNGADPNMELSNGNYPLRAAILAGDGECCRILLEHGADVNHCSSRGTPLMAAAASGDCESLTLLLDSGAALDAEAKDGLTALATAVRDNQKEAVRLLLRRGASPTKPNKDGVSPVDIAQERTLPEVYSLLMQASITHAADEALRASDQRQAEAREEIAAAAEKAAAEVQQELARNRAETADRVAAIRGETDELLKRLGISREMKGGKGAGKG
ncbi:hypothetical protein PLESTB_001360300 [Pleodorina starrii]|uniref:Uncharacterized protein n=1 Tax=Pleodorina starrii TaxID=330485 RepID=A0A9W6BUZ7_9CHLO|nr:hypothetical protein PLESTM_002067300 [Pleodorina starrii]GLC58450.1 hypothetical protein PLESTB_001360300 [Pleodorina starrii]GLC77444.1 hypothetical protein PLESTF_001936700 [Pleodorina starrii]